MIRRVRKFSRGWAAWAVCLGVTAAAWAAGDRLQLVWPTPNTAWSEGKPPTAFLQHAGSGDPESGGFGGVRTGGRQFHEGIDIRALHRDRRGEPTDDVFAAMSGVVRHVSTSAGDSSYGRYIVLEHTDLSPAIYTLYAHLAAIAPGVRAGVAVTAGQVLGTMGHSSGGYMIPKERAHLHFEVGLAMTRDFQSWYDRKGFGSRNDHGMWNGYNLMGVDPIEFFNDWRGGRFTTVQEFFQHEPTVVRLRIATARTPDFVMRYPALLTKPLPLGPVAGWEIRFNWTGLPFAWTPLTAMETLGLPPNTPRILEVNADIERRERSKSLAVQRRGQWTIGKDLQTALELLFGTIRS
jgi:murein DD-endopeptidase MepM/ murein hydrolase activator NlpD